MILMDVNVLVYAHREDEVPLTLTIMKRTVTGWSP